MEQPVPADEKLRRIIRYQVTLLAVPARVLQRGAAEEKREYDRAIERVVREGIAEGRFRSLPR